MFEFVKKIYSTVKDVRYTINNFRSLFYIKFLTVLYGYFYNHISSTTAFYFIVLFFFLWLIFLPADCDMVLKYSELYGKSIDTLRGKVVWITGASTGIGEGLAVALAKRKVKLVLSARSEDKLQDVKKRCLETGKVSAEEVLVLPFDMLNYDVHHTAFSTIINHFGKLDVLVSNAGRSQRARWTEIDLSVDREIFELNTFSLIHLARIVTRHFLTVGGGKHVVMSSVAGLVGAPLSSSYSGSKFALQGYFESLRSELGSKGISVNVLCPGPVESNIMAGVLGEKLDQDVNRSRAGKVMSTERCAHLSLLAMANDVKESWICQQPVLFIVYLSQYCPLLMKTIPHMFDVGELYLRSRDRGSTATKVD